MNGSYELAAAIATKRAQREQARVSRTRWGMRMPADIRRQLKQAATVQQSNMSEIVLELLRFTLPELIKTRQVPEALQPSNQSAKVPSGSVGELDILAVMGAFRSDPKFMKRFYDKVMDQIRKDGAVEWSAYVALTLAYPGREYPAGAYAAVTLNDTPNDSPIWVKVVGCDDKRRLLFALVVGESATEKDGRKLHGKYLAISYDHVGEVRVAPIRAAKRMATQEIIATDMVDTMCG